MSPWPLKACPVTVLCRVGQVSRRGFYSYLHYVTGSQNRPSEQRLKERVTWTSVSHLLSVGNPVGIFKTTQKGVALFSATP